MAIEKESAVPPPKKIYFNRELSWLAFNRRVLKQAESEQYPILERMRYLSFVSSNLDEFYEIRVAGLMQQIDSGVSTKTMDGITLKDQLDAIQKLTTSLVKDKYRCWQQQIIPALRKEKIFFKDKADLSEAEGEWVKHYFEKEIYPILTPLATDPAHPFPHLANKALNILVALSDHKTPRTLKKMAIIPVPRILPRVVKMDGLDKDHASYIFLSNIIEIFADHLFPGYTVRGAWSFRITRNSDLYIDIEEEQADNLLHKIEKELLNLRKGAAVRLEIQKGISKRLLNQLLAHIELSPQDTFCVNGPINLMRLMSVYNLIDRPDLKFPSFRAHIPSALANKETLFANIKRRDHLLHHPYDSFLPVVEFIHQAARDPQVFAIKQTLYRTSGDSPIINALIEASKNGKQVTTLIELKARFDEANNIVWARRLEEAGVHVVYGLVGLKIHCKCCLVVRREQDGFHHYAHLATGNYNPKTARCYTDFSFFTGKAAITKEVAALFNTLTGFSSDPNFEKLLIAPFNLHDNIQALILREAANAKAGKPARIIAKLNSLIDQTSIDHLYYASNCGVKIDLIIRGICGLIPGIKGLSENIQVRSILGRFLEHSRIFYFQNHGYAPDIYVGSADWMPRNFFKRIEAVFPIENAQMREQIQSVLSAYLKDNAQATILQPDGCYKNIQQKAEDPVFDIQEALIPELNPPQ